MKKNETAPIKKKKPMKTSPLGTNSSLIRRPMKRMFPLFILPTLAAFCIGFLYPFLDGIFLSFHKYNLPADAEFVAFDNYAKIFSGPLADGFFQSFKFTALFTVVSVIAINVIAFAVAYALTQKMKGSNVFRTVFFMPNLIGGIVLGYIWKMILTSIISNFATSASAGFWGLQLLMAWQQIGYMMIIYIAGLQAIPGDMMEAATIDGANRWKSLIHVTIPNMMPSITICTFLTLTNSFKLYDQNFALTGGLPVEKNIGMTQMLAMNIKATYDISNKYHGVAQAKAVIFFIVVAIISIAQLTMTRSKEVQQ